MEGSRTDPHTLNSPPQRTRAASMRCLSSPLQPASRTLRGSSHHLPRIENPQSTTTHPASFNPELCGGSAPHEFLIRWTDRVPTRFDEVSSSPSGDYAGGFPISSGSARGPFHVLRIRVAQ